ncbi:MAG TPA: bifunctional DNA-formamidopyrimidine glycosylase/DNA-(apurinic or apyrimidinic site) lyase, partial [Solirubrobacteraceae bacterium]|nr:bifunctional DNA-formamidopyrimidine glycosylase/DNA-(apurinic or apyrimidinic site) lyase [Solirubrobacteraceae bacterium]
MPELPEVETIRRQLAPALEGRRIVALDVLDPRWCEPLAPAELADAVAGRTVAALARRGKYLDWQLADELHLLMHLRMTGTLLLGPPLAPPYARVGIELDGGARLWFCDPRRFGTGQLVAGDGALERFLAERLGPEPFDPAFGGAHLRARARGRRGPVKSFLLDQRNVAGVGNIYADEALYRAGVHPLRPAGALRPRQYDLLAAAVIEVLESGIDAKGASIDDFRHLDGARGSFQDRFLVHRREGEPCPACGRAIEKIV